MSIVFIVDDSQVDQSLVRGILAKNRELEVRSFNNGVDALAEIPVANPDLVVTDLMMPEMDGLQVVTRIRNEFPETPVILMTSQGNEQTALEALQKGAASFVPKSRLTDRLYDTVSQVLALKNPGTPYREIMQCVNQAELAVSLPSDLQLIPQFVDLIQRSLSSLCVCDATESIRLSLAVEEALLNALLHGNLELTTDMAKSGLEPNAEYFHQRSSELPYSQRTIDVKVKIDKKQALFSIRDHGPGFDSSALPDENDLTPFQDGTGRGLKLMRSFMDGVSFNDSGNEVTLVRRF